RSARPGSTGGSLTFRRRRERRPEEQWPEEQWPEEQWPEEQWNVERVTGWSSRPVEPGPWQEERTMTRTPCICVALALGVAALANGLFMLAGPEAWYFAVPGVTDTGPFNQHFVRDIGLIFLFIGAAFLAGAALPGYRVVLWLTPTLWLWGHALFHF